MNEIVPTMEAVFNCRPVQQCPVLNSHIMQFLKLIVVPMQPWQCEDSDAVVVKTIRLRLDKFVQWYNSSSIRGIKVQIKY